MEKSIQQIKYKAMTLVEVLVALAIVSFVFSSLTAMAFDSLSRTKKLELQDQMRAFASEASEVIYNTKNSSWNTFSVILSPAITGGNNSSAYIQTVTDEDTGKIEKKLQSFTGTDTCHYDSTREVLVGDCIKTLPSPGQERQLFGRVIVRTDTTSADSDNNAKLTVIVACLEEECDSSDFKPFILSLNIFRTGGTN